MKKNYLLLSIALFFLLLLSACKNEAGTKTTPPEATTLSAEEKETKKKEISARIGEIIEGCKQLNVAIALKPYLNSPDFMIVNPDGTIDDYAGMVKLQEGFFSEAASIRFTTIKEDFHFFSKDLVVCTWSGKNEFELKAGGKFLIEPYTGSMFFKKVNNEWKIVYAHEAAAQPKEIK